jgi:hypothetical protein
MAYSELLDFLFEQSDLLLDIVALGADGFDVTHPIMLLFQGRNTFLGISELLLIIQGQRLWEHFRSSVLPQPFGWRHQPLGGEHAPWRGWKVCSSNPEQVKGLEPSFSAFGKKTYVSFILNVRPN